MGHYSLAAVENMSDFTTLEVWHFGNLEPSLLFEVTLIFEPQTKLLSLILKLLNTRIPKVVRKAYLSFKSVVFHVTRW